MLPRVLRDHACIFSQPCEFPDRSTNFAYENAKESKGSEVIIAKSRRDGTEQRGAHAAGQSLQGQRHESSKLLDLIYASPVGQDTFATCTRNLSPALVRRPFCTNGLVPLLEALLQHSLAHDSPDDSPCWRSPVTK